MKVKERMLFSRIDASIRHHLRKPGLSLVKNTYVGFDTEFNNIDLESNSLVSAQMAITSGMYLKVPITPRYTISKLDIEANKLYKLRTSSEIFNYSKVETSIQMCIQPTNQPNKI
jgi:hypothetical protein